MLTQWMLVYCMGFFDADMCNRCVLIVCNPWAVQGHMVGNDWQRQSTRRCIEEYELTFGSEARALSDANQKL